MKKVIATMLLAAASAMAISATRVGPVSTYGELKANGGKLVGSCPEYANKAVQVKGMSLFWSSGSEESTAFYSEDGVYRLVDEMKVEVLRFAMGVSNDFDEGRGYAKGETGAAKQKAMLRTVVNAAIEKDIYLIIDWHIESSTGYTEQAMELFEWAAKEFGSYNNIIFEIWNEPTGDMATVKAHADAVIPKIRQYSDNLILVGSPAYSSQPNACANAGIQDNNYGCTLHFYAASHSASGEYANNASSALGAGVPVFATEWGTVQYTGDGSPDQQASQAWIDWMNTNKVSWTNWNASAMDETSAAFTSRYLDQGLQYSTSGNMVKAWMNSNVAYKDCGLQNGSASEESGFSTGVANGATTNMIDDMEDGDRYTYIGGAWSAFEDNNDGGLTSITNPKIEDDFGKQTYDVLLPADAAGGNTSKYMVGITGIKLGLGTLNYAPNAVLSLNITKDTSVYADFAKCKTIKYRYKGAKHIFRIETTDVTDWNFHRIEKVASKDWKEVEISVDELKQETWEGGTTKVINLAHAQRMGWIVSTDKVASVQPEYDFLYLDDLSCDGLEIKAVSAMEAPVATSSSGISPTSSGSSSSVLAGSSSAIVPTSSGPAYVDLLVIDDVEDVNEVLNTTGTWYAYTDKDPGGLSVITNTYDETLPGYVVVFPGTTDPTNGTAGFVGINGIAWNQGTYAQDPFVALGLNMVADTSMGYDLSTCSALSYRYKGNAHTFKIQDGQVTDWAYHQYKSLSSSEWTTVVMTWDDLVQPTWGEYVELNKASIKKMAWEVVGAAGLPNYQPELDYLYVDDLKCVQEVVSIKGARVASNSIKLGVQGSMLSVNLDKAGAVRVQIFDMMGHVVENIGASMNAGSNTVSLEKMSKGSYVVRVIRGSEVKATRVTIR